MKKIFKRFFPAIPVVFVLASMMFSHSCANTTKSPSGGVKDTIPPLVVAVSPENMATNLPCEGLTITITFDEYVNIKTPTGIVLSPPQAKAPISKIKGKSLVVSFDEALDSNTTYTLQFSDAIADNNEGNKFLGFTYVFSTGDCIDSLMMTGTVLDCNTLAPQKGIKVFLYKDHSDSAVILHRPYASTITDDWGFFCLRNIKDTSYRLYAVKDDNNNNLYDYAENELIAFCDSAVTPVIVVNDSLPEVMRYDMKDTLACLARKSERELVLFREKPTRQMIMKKVRVTDRSSYITFNAPNAHIDSMWVRGVPASKLITQFNIQRDSLEIWINDKAKQPDTLHLFVNYRKTDSTGRLKPELEHVKLYYHDEEGGSGSSSGTKASKSSKSGKQQIAHKDTICQFTLAGEAERIEQYGYELEFTYPVINQCFDSLSLKSINPKQIEAEMKYKVIKDTNNLRKFTVMPDEKLLPGYDYVLKIPHKGFRDINGFYNDSTEVKVTLPSDEKLSTVNLVLTGVNQKYIIELLDGAKRKILRTYVIDSDCTLTFPYLKADKYCFRITSDANRNSIVDTGSLLGHRQPEKVIFYKPDGKEFIDVMESAEIEQNINLNELFNE